MSSGLLNLLLSWNLPLSPLQYFICGAVLALRAFRYTLMDFYMYPTAPIKFWHNLIHVKGISDTDTSDSIAIRDICTKNSICTSQ
jgi:hypothetical protein